jgi:colanic acid/amylovoran biosynthesis glycosyltransferase
MSAQGQVIHFNKLFFERTQTFLYNLVVGSKRWEPVLGCEELVNQQEFPINGIRSLNPFPRAGTPGGLCHRVLRKAGVRDIPFDRVLQRTNARLVHAHFGPNGIYAELACRRRRTPLVVSFYGFDSAPPDSQMGRAWVSGYRRLFATAKTVLVEGPCIARKLQTVWNCPAERIQILRISIPIEQITPRQTALDRNGRVRLLFCGRFMEKKGLGVLIEALGRLGPEAKNFSLRVIGDGEVRPDHERRLEALGLRGIVELLGSQPRARFWQELETCHLLVAPSVTARNGDTEGGAPTVLLEAQAAGVPLVTTDHADIPFVVVPGKSAFMAREGDVDSLAEALRDAVKQSSRWLEMGQTGRKHVLENHSTQAVCQRLEEIYDSVTESINSSGERQARH